MPERSQAGRWRDTGLRFAVLILCLLRFRDLPAGAENPPAGSIVEKAYEGPSVESVRLREDVESLKRLKEDVERLKREVESLKREIRRSADRPSGSEPEQDAAAKATVDRLPDNPSRPLIRDVERFDGHTGSVQSVAVSDDGLLGASTGDDGVIRLWDLRRFRDHRILFPPGGRGHQLLSLAISPDGKLLAAGGAGLFVFRIESGELLHELKAEGGWVDGVRFSRDGRSLVSVGRGTVRFWNLETGTETRSVPAPTEVVNSVDLARDGRVLCAGGYFNNSETPVGSFVRLWDPASGAESFRLTYPVRTAFRQAILIGDDARVLTVGPDGSLREWDVASGEEVRVWRDGGVGWVALSRDHQLVAVGAHEAVELRDAETGDLVDAMSLPGVNVQTIGLSGDGRRVVYSGFHDIVVRSLRFYPPTPLPTER